MRTVLTRCRPTHKHPPISSKNLTHLSKTLLEGEQKGEVDILRLTGVCGIGAAGGGGATGLQTRKTKDRTTSPVSFHPRANQGARSRPLGGVS